MTTKIKTKYRNIEGQEDGHLRILDEKFKGVAVSVGKVSIDGSGDEESATLSYDYDILEVPEGIEINEEFNQLLGDIIVDMLETKLKDNPGSLRFNDNSEN